MPAYLRTDRPWKATSSRTSPLRGWMFQENVQPAQVTCLPSLTDSASALSLDWPAAWRCAGPATGEKSKVKATSQKKARRWIMVHLRKVIAECHDERRRALPIL